MTAPARFKQSDITRLFRAAKNAGYTNVRVGVDVTGNLVAEASDAPIAQERRNPLDRLLT